MLWSTCPECGGILEPVAQPGRTRSYRGKPGFVIPEDMEIPTCHQCGTTWMTSEMIKRLDEEFEMQRFTMLDRDSQFVPLK